MRSWRRVPSLTPGFFLLAGIASIASGCQDRLWNPGYQFIAPDGGGVDAKKDATTDRGGPDVTGLGAFGGSASAGRGGSGGAGGTAGSGGTGGSVVMCSNTAPERQTDISNCG